MTPPFLKHHPPGPSHEHRRNGYQSGRYPFWLTGPSHPLCRVSSVKRNAEQTIRLARTLAKEGHRVTPRKLERWSHQGLGPTATTDLQFLVRHYGQVASLSTTGRDADVVARRLAARGYPCDRLRGAILAELGIPSHPPPTMPPVLDLSSEPSGDAAFAALEEMAQAVVADTPGLPPLMVKVLQALYRNAAERSKELGEPASAIFHWFIVNSLAHLLGCDYYNGAAMEAVLGLANGTISVTDLDVMNSAPRMSIPDLEDTYRTVPVEEIAFVAHRLTMWVPHLLRYLEVTGASEAEIEELVPVLTPGAIYYANLLRNAFDAFPDEPFPLAPPLPALPVAASH